MLSPMTVVTGIMAFLSTCLKTIRFSLKPFARATLMKSCWMISSTLERVILATRAVGVPARAMEGRTRYRMASKLAGFPAPISGNHPSRIEKKSISKMPSQKRGMEARNSATTMLMRSKSVSLLTADTTPAGSPMRTEKRTAAPASSMV